LNLRPGVADAELERLAARLRTREQLVDVDAVAGLRRHAPGGRVRVREEAEALELRELVPDRGRRDGERRALDERLRAERLPGRDVLLDEEPEDVALAVGEDDLHPSHGRQSLRRGAVR